MNSSALQSRDGTRPNYEESHASESLSSIDEMSGGLR